MDNERYFDYHEAAAVALVDLIYQNPGLRVVAVAPQFAIANYAREALITAAEAKGMERSAGGARYLVNFGNGARVTFFSAEHPDRMAGLNCGAAWLIARQMFGRMEERVIEAVDQITARDLVKDGILSSHG